MNYYRLQIKLTGESAYRTTYYKFSSNVAWVREKKGDWHLSGIFSNEKKFLEWVQKGRRTNFKVEEITEQELFIDLL